MIKTIHNNWLQEFKNELKDTKKICVVSPFITDNMVSHLLENFDGNTIKVITRYNLNEFRRGVSRLTAITNLLNSGAEIKGIKGLHSKLYLFDQKSVMITSANFTNGGFFNNKEFGILSTENNTIKESQEYFEFLWKINPDILHVNETKYWQEEIERTKGNLIVKGEKLEDHGASYQESIIGEKRYFVKFFGRAEHRLPLTTEVTQELRDGCSHFALSFSKGKGKRDPRPIRYRDGDVVFMARMTQEPDDYIIFGRAIAVAHDRTRDIVSNKDIENIFWLKDWPILVRVKEPIYIDSTLMNCPKLSELMNELRYDCFKSTRDNFNKGHGNINPRKSLMRKADVILSSTGAQWMELAFQSVLKKEGKIEDSFVKKLYQGLKITK